ncbi:MAG: hypothetical protein ABSA47_19885, partial [Verrucomicrobiota bacterium]
GVRGAKIFARVWFPFMYLLLAAVNAAAWLLAPDWEMSRWDRVFLGCVVGGLTVVGASVLTRMWLQLLAETKELERRGKAG